MSTILVDRIPDNKKEKESSKFKVIIISQTECDQESKTAKDIDVSGLNKYDKAWLALTSKEKRKFNDLFERND